MAELPPFLYTDDVIYIGGYFFFRVAVLKKSDPLITDTFQELYRFISSN